MGAAWISWGTILTLTFTASQIPAVTGVKTTAVTREEGETLYFTCEYPQSWLNNTKYVCRMDDYDNHLIHTDRHNQWETNGRFSLYDNTTASFLLVKVERLVPQDSGTYWCGVDVSSYPDHINVILLNVSEEKKALPTDVPLHKLNMSLFLTAAMCVAAILFVCLFTLCLLYAVKHQRAVSRQSEETSVNYETVTPVVGPEREPAPFWTCSHCDYTSSSALPAPPPDLCSHFTPNHRESAVTLSEYVDVEARGHACQYQQLDLSQLEDHVYHSLCGPKD